MLIVHFFLLLHASRKRTQRSHTSYLRVRLHATVGALICMHACMHACIRFACSPRGFVLLSCMHECMELHAALGALMCMQACIHAALEARFCMHSCSIHACSGTWGGMHACMHLRKHAGGGLILTVEISCVAADENVSSSVPLACKSCIFFLRSRSI